MIVAGFHARGKRLDLGGRVHDAGNIDASKGFATRGVSEKHEHMAELRETCITRVGHVHAHGVDARRNLRIGLRKPNATTEHGACQRLTF